MTDNPANQQLLEQLLEDSSLTGLLEKCAQLLGCPLCFFFHSGPDGFLVTEGYPSADVIQIQAETVRSDNSIDERLRLLLEQFSALHGEQPFRLVPRNPGMTAHLCCIVTSGGRILGIITLPEYLKSMEEMDQSLMALCARCVGFRFLQSAGQPSLSAARQGMHMLLSARGVSYGDLARLPECGILPRFGSYRLLVMRRDSAAARVDIAVPAEQIARLFATDWYACWKQEAAVLFEESRSVPAVRPELGRLLELGVVSACLSPVFRDLMDAPVWKQRMVQLPAFRRATPGSLTLFDEWSDWGLFAETRLSPARLRAFIPPEIQAVREWDREHGTAYLPTLREFIRCGCRRNQAAAALKTHINTVNYRLQKAEELFGIDFRVPDTVSRISFAIRLMDCLDLSQKETGDGSLSLF